MKMVCSTSPPRSSSWGGNEMRDGLEKKREKREKRKGEGEGKGGNFPVWRISSIQRVKRGGKEGKRSPSILRKRKRGRGKRIPTSIVVPYLPSSCFSETIMI